MALKDEDTLLKRKKELDEAMEKLGLSFDIEEENEEDVLAEQFTMDEAAMSDMMQNKK